MNMLKATKWFGFAMLCLVILSIPLALAGLGFIRGAPERHSHEQPVQKDGEQIDLLLSGQKIAQNVFERGAAASEYWPSEGTLPQASSVQVEEQRTGRISETKFDRTAEESASTSQDLDVDSDGVYRMGGIAALDPSNGGTHNPRGGYAVVDPTLRPDQICQLGGIAALDPSNGGTHNPLGGIAAVDPNNGRLNPLGGIAALDPSNGVVRNPLGGIAAVDPNNGRLDPMGGYVVVDPTFGTVQICQLGGIAAVDPNNGQLDPLGGIAAVDPNNDQLTPMGGIAALDPDNGGSR